MDRISSKRRLASLCSVLILGAASAARGETIYGITASDTGPQTLVRFDSGAPGVVTTIGPLTGFAPGQIPLAIDFRPATGQLYVGAGGDAFPGPGAQAYTANLNTGVLTPVGPAFDSAGLGLPSFDFNPVTDELRVALADTGPGTNNSRFNPNTGALIAFDTDVAFAPGDLNAGFNPPRVAGIAYSNNVAGATSTTLFAYELQSDDFTTIGGVSGTPGVNGGQMSTIGDSGFVVPGSLDSFGFDISGPSGIAYVSTLTEELEGYHLFTVGLTGRMTDVGAIGLPDGTSLLDISVAVPEPASLSVILMAMAPVLRRRRTA